MVHFLVLSSGSCGNSYAFYDGTDTIVIDQGLTFTGFTKRLLSHEIPPSSVRAIFLTHLHPDHSKGVGATQRKLNIPAFLSDISLKMSQDVIAKMRMSSDLLRSFHHGETIKIRDFLITAHRSYHDCPGSSFYIIENAGKKIFLMTDTGQIPYEAHASADDADVIFLESNYDVDMLRNGPYPKRLQDRISGGYGHLSNDEASFFLKQHAKLRAQVYLIHLSENNNTPEKARRCSSEKLRSGIFLTVCERGESYEGYIDE